MAKDAERNLGEARARRLRLGAFGLYASSEPSSREVQNRQVTGNRTRIGRTLCRASAFCQKEAKTSACGGRGFGNGRGIANAGARLLSRGWISPGEYRLERPDPGARSYCRCCRPL